MSGLDTPPPSPEGAAFRFGVKFVIASFGVLIASGVVAFAVVRFRAEEWPPADYGGPPPGVFLSTILVVLTSVAAERALRAARRDDSRALRNGLFLSAVLLAGFLAVQVWNGAVILDVVGAGRTKDLYAFGWFLLMGLHALHILGGLIPLAVTAVRAGRGRYDRASHDGVWGVVVYLHFLALAWLVMLVVLLA